MLMKTPLLRRSANTLILPGDFDSLRSLHLPPLPVTCSASSICPGFQYLRHVIATSVVFPFEVYMIRSLLNIQAAGLSTLPGFSSASS